MVGGWFCPWWRHTGNSCGGLDYGWWRDNGVSRLDCCSPDYRSCMTNYWNCCGKNKCGCIQESLNRNTNFGG